MQQIELANGRGVALVDDADYEVLRSYSWCLKPCLHTNYAKTSTYGPKQTIFMHRMLIPEGARIDHIDGNGLNNQRSNLRVCSHAQNMCNTRPYRGKQFKGVSQVKATGRWRAYIHLHGKQVNLGFYQTEEAAAVAYDQAAQRHFGEYARLNFAGPTRTPAVVLDACLAA